MVGAFRRGLLRASLLAAVGGVAMVAAPSAIAQSQTRQFDIPAQPLGAALLEFSRQSDVLIIFSPDITSGKKSRPVSGAKRVNVAIAELLRGSDLRAVPNPKGGYRVERILRGRSSAARRPQDKIVRTVSPVAASQEVVSARVPEIIVTAQKRSEPLQDTPVPVTVIDPRQLAERNQTRLQDYFDQVPGVGLNAQGNGKTNIIIRGISTGVFGNPTVAVSIDDVPYGSSTALADGQLVQPDLDPADLERIEVLRGPQGTLYGAASLGGLIKYVTKDPSVESASGRIQSDISAVHKGEAGYGLRGSVNLPLGKSAAIRASAFSRRTPGYVDNALTGGEDVNRIDVVGGRVGLLVQPTETLTVRFGAMHQNSHGDGSSRVTTDYRQRQILGDLNRSALPGSGAYRTRSTLFTANVDLDLDGIEFKSVTGYGRNLNKESSDSSGLFASISPGSYLSSNMRTEKFTQELRLSSPAGQTVEWLIGGFYTSEDSQSIQSIDSADPVTGLFLANLLTADFPTTYEEAAAFGDVTYHFTPEFNLQFGLRYSRNWQRYSEIDLGPLGEVSPGVPFTASVKSKDDAVTFLVVPQFRVSPHLMTYFRFASGYRPGGPNGSAALFDLPPTFDADTTLNYELGLKGDAFDGRLTFDVAAYYIDWRRVQVRILDPDAQLFSYFTNGGKADSKGVEAAFHYRGPHGLRLSLTGSYNLARYSATPPAGVGAFKGDRLPFSSKFSGSVSADQDVVLDDRWTAYVGTTLSYVGERKGPFAQRPGNMRIELPGFVRLDLRVGVRKDEWTIGLFARNITDRRGTLATTTQTARATVTSIYGTNFITPRTIGLYLDRSF